MNTEHQCEMIDLSHSTGLNMSVAGQLTGEMAMHAMRGEMRTHEPMSKHTSWRAGGYAERYYIPADLADLACFLQHLPADEPVYVIGLGSNLLIRDGGLRGTVVAVHAQLNDLQWLEQQDNLSGLIYAGAGVACAKVARFAAKDDFAGAEFLAGKNEAILFGLLSSSYKKNMSGEVMRKVVSSFRNEVNQTTGQFTVNATIVQHFNALRVRDFTGQSDSKRLSWREIVR